MLTSETAAELGDARRIAIVAFQEAPEHPVRDLVITAARTDEIQQSLELAIAIRRTPKMIDQERRGHADAVR